ncbi:MAG: M12 family metallo-peptidase [Pseudomonadota bacterium]
MTSLFVRGSLLTLVVGSLASPVAFAATDLHKFAMIDGISRELVLQENRELMQSLPVENGTAVHYTGQLVDFPDSWARLSRIDGQWQGVVVNSGEIFLVEQLADSPQEAKSRSAEFAVSAVKSFEELGDCAVAHPPAGGSSAPQARALTSQALVGQAVSVNFPAYCSATVNGTCLVAELTVVFDEKFKQAFPSNYPSQAASLLNTLDGFYRQDFKIVFRHLRLDFDNGSTFTTSRDPYDLLADIGEKRFNNSISSFDPNKRSLLHMVTGRDFSFEQSGDINDDVVGLAYSPDYDISNYPNSFYPVLCDSDGSAVGTSQLLYSGNTPSATRTALVVAHEIGHNLGAEHDGTTDSVTASSCTDATKIMNPYVVSNPSGFSTCSQSTIATNISRLPAVEACFDFPVDASLAAVSGNLTQTTPETAFIQQYTAGFSTANGVNGTVTVSGTLNGGDATFSTVTLAGNGCTLSNGNQTYTCTTGSLASPSALAVSLNANSTHVSIAHSITPSSANHLYDVDAADNNLSDTILVRDADLPPNSLTATLSGNDVQLAWQDHATNEQGFVVERKKGDGEWTVMAAALATNSVSYTDADVASQSSYTYRVSALFDGERSAPSNEVSIDVSIAPSGSMRIGGSGKGGGGSLSPLLLAFMAGMASLLAFLQRKY